MSHHTTNPGQYPEPGQNAYGLNQGPYATPPQQPKKKRKWPWIVGGAAALLIIVSVASNGDEAKDSFQDGYNDATGNTTQVDERPTPVEAPPAAPAPAAPKGLPDNGVLKVGTDIQPGEYTVTVGDDRFMDTGYWERLSCTTGDFSCILSNEIVQGPGYLTVLPTDVAVKVQNAQLNPAG